MKSRPADGLGGDERAPRQSLSLRAGIVCLVLSAALWSFAGVFVKFFSLRIDAETQNLFRYAAAAVGLWAVTLVAFRADILRALRQWRLFVPPTLFNCLFQVAAVGAMYRRGVYPGFVSLVTQSSVILGAAMAYILFRDERKTILSWTFALGCVMGVAGVAGVLMGGEMSGAEFNSGAWMALLAAFWWACYTVSMKQVVLHTTPIVAFTMVATLSTLGFWALAAWQGQPMRFFGLDGRTQALVLISGVMCISTAHSFYFLAVRRLGVAVCSSFSLTTPLMTGALSALLFGERMTRVQIIMGMVLLTGVYVILRARGANRA